MKYLYKSGRRIVGENAEAADISSFTPKMGELTLRGEKISLKLLAVRLLFQIMTRGRARVFYVRRNGKLVHTSYVLPRCAKFPFLTEGDYEIGPCFTYPEFRGKGIYPAVLEHIRATCGNENTTFYMCVDENNGASIKGIEKAGFERSGEVYVAGFLKKYHICQ